MTAIQTTSGATLACVDVGSGPPALALHGAYSAHQEIRAFLDPVLPGCRRVYPDLPGMGSSSAAGIESAQDAVEALDELVTAVLGDEPFTLVAHSFGAHLARGLAARRPDQVRGLALLCPMVSSDQHMEPAAVVADDGAAASLPRELAEAYTGYFVVQTAATLARFHEAVVPVLGHWDDQAVEPLMTNDTLDLGGEYTHPVLVMTGRQDAWVGYRQHVGLLAAYPRATSVVVADAGHALPHERPEVMGAALALWHAAATRPGA